MSIFLPLKWVNDQGNLLGFNNMKCHYNLGPHHRVIWNEVTELVLTLVLGAPSRQRSHGSRLDVI